MRELPRALQVNAILTGAFIGGLVAVLAEAKEGAEIDRKITEQVIASMPLLVEIAREKIEGAR